MAGAVKYNLTNILQALVDVDAADQQREIAPSALQALIEVAIADFPTKKKKAL